MTKVATVEDLIQIEEAAFQTAYQTGKSDYGRGVQITAKPYAVSAILQGKWEEGWKDAHSEAVESFADNLVPAEETRFINTVEDVVSLLINLDNPRPVVLLPKSVDATEKILADAPDNAIFVIAIEKQKDNYSTAAI